MHIQPSGTPNLPLDPIRKPQGTNSAVSGGTNQQLPSVDQLSMDSLVSTLASQVDVRDALVAEIKLKIETGEYLTQQAAVETADAILNL